jgi:hypothetical protein
MMRRRFLILGVLLTAIAPLSVETVSAQQAMRECTTLTCAKCTSICAASCEAENKACNAKAERNCPRNFRSCTRACPSMLCAQCVPIQYGSDGRKFMPGKTELCRTPGKFEAKKG